MSCPQEPIPPGWRLWKGAVPAPLVQMAIDVRDKVHNYPYGTIATTAEYSGQTVGTFVSHHTWTYKNGQLVTGICIPGVSLVTQDPIGAALGPAPNPSEPDPTLAVYGTELGTDWGLVAVCGVAIGAITGAFLFVLRKSPGR